MCSRIFFNLKVLKSVRSNIYHGNGKYPYCTQLLHFFLTVKRIDYKFDVDPINSMQFPYAISISLFNCPHSFVSFNQAHVGYDFSICDCFIVCVEKITAVPWFKKIYIVNSSYPLYMRVHYLQWLKNVIQICYYSFILEKKARQKNLSITWSVFSMIRYFFCGLGLIFNTLSLTLFGKGKSIFITSIARLPWHLWMFSTLV